MRFSSRAFALPLLLLASLALAQKTADTTTTADLLKDGAKWDKKRVRVVGTVSKLSEKKSKAGNEYFTFDLTDNDKAINVFGYGKVEGLKDGAKVAATGKFAVTKKMRNFEVKNELDVSAPRPRKKKDASGTAAGDEKPEVPGKPNVEILK